jgi:hypothetical protein
LPFSIHFSDAFTFLGGKKKMMSHTSRITKQDSKGKIAASGGGGEGLV